MQGLILEKTVEDGRTFNFHNIYEVKKLDMDNLATIVVASYHEIPKTFNPTPQYKTEITVPIIGDFADFILNSLSVVHEQPEWRDATMVQ